MADDEEGQDEGAPAPAREPFGGKGAPLFKKKGGTKKFLDDHKLAVISTLVAIIGLVYLVLHNRASSTAGSTSSAVSGQSTAASNAPGTVDGTPVEPEPSPSDFQPWWSGSAGGGGGGGLTTTGTPASSSGTPAPHKPASGAAQPQPASHPRSQKAKGSAASVAAKPHAAALAGFYAPIEPSSSPVHSVSPTAHPASHVAVGTSRNGSNVLVPFTVRTGQVPPTGSSAHLAASAKRPAGTRATGRR